MPIIQFWMKLSIRRVTMKKETSWPNSASDTPKDTLFRKSKKTSHRPDAAEPNTSAAVNMVITTAPIRKARSSRIVSSDTGSVEGPRENRKVK